MNEYVRIGDATNLGSRGRLSYASQIGSMGRIFEIPYITKLINWISSVNRQMDYSSEVVRNIDLEATINIVIELISEPKKQIDINTKVITD